MITQEDNGQQLLGSIEADRQADRQLTGYECAVLVTNTGYEILGLGQPYRDRADAENAFDELKNQWDRAVSPRMTCIVASFQPGQWR